MAQIVFGGAVQNRNSYGCRNLCRIHTWTTDYSNHGALHQSTPTTPTSTPTITFDDHLYCTLSSPVDEHHWSQQWTEALCMLLQLSCRFGKEDKNMRDPETNTTHRSDHDHAGKLRGCSLMSIQNTTNHSIEFKVGSF